MTITPTTDTNGYNCLQITNATYPVTVTMNTGAYGPGWGQAPYNLQPYFQVSQNGVQVTNQMCLYNTAGQQVTINAPATGNTTTIYLYWSDSNKAVDQGNPYPLPTLTTDSLGDATVSAWYSAIPSAGGGQMQVQSVSFDIHDATVAVWSQVSAIIDPTNSIPRGQGGNGTSTASAAPKVKVISGSINTGATLLPIANAATGLNLWVGYYTTEGNTSTYAQLSQIYLSTTTTNQVIGVASPVASQFVMQMTWNNATGGWAYQSASVCSCTGSPSQMQITFSNPDPNCPGNPPASVTVTITVTGNTLPVLPPGDSIQVSL